MWLYLLICFIVLCAVHIIFNYNGRARMLKKIPGPKLDFIVGNGIQVIRSPVEIMKMGREFARKWKNIYRLWIFPLGGVFILGPEDVERNLIMWLYLLLFSIVLCAIHIIFNYNGRARMMKKIPGPKLDFIVGNGIHVIRSPVELMKMARVYARQWKNINRIWIFPIGAVLIYNPEDVETVTSNMKYSDKSMIYSIMKPWLGDGLLISSGNKWQVRRKILTPTFHFNILRQFFEIIAENGNRLVSSLNEKTGKSIDVVPVLSEFTLNAICETAMGTKLNEETSGAGKSYKDAIYALGYIFLQRFMKVYLYPDFIYKMTSLFRQQTKHVKSVHNFTEKVINSRREYLETHGINFEDLDDDNYGYSRKRKTAMLDLLITAEKEGLIDKQGIQEEVDTFMFEGHDTTASGLTFCLMLLANHKDIQDKIVAELHDLFGDENRPFRLEDLTKLTYTERCIKESMRLYPPVHFISRSLNETTVLSNYRIPAGTMCHIPIYDLHHRPDLYEDPEVFDPERFTPDKCATRHPYAYIPFSAGPRNCIGQKFAMMEMKVAVAEILRNFELVPVTKPSDIEFVADVVLRNNGPVNVIFVKRQ